MASCGEVDHSASLLASRKGGSDSLPGSGGSSPSLPVPECAICLQSCVHPVRLPCRHIFCFLCVKGASWQSKRCALCRQEVPEDFLERPTLLSPEELKASASGKAPGEYAWYYEGRNGWWQYDERTSRELEDAFAKGKKTAEMLIAGFLYVADLENMVQYRRNEHGRRRKMKRDVVDIPKKGVAGLRLDSEAVAQTASASAAAAAAPSTSTTGGRESSADGADTYGVPGTSTGGSSTNAAGAQPPQLLVPPGRPPTTLGGLLMPTSPSGYSSSSSDDGLSLERAFVHLRIGRSPAPERGGVLEGEEDEEDVDDDEDYDETSPSHISSSHDASVDESVPESSTEDEDDDSRPTERQLEDGGEEGQRAASGPTAPPMAWPRQRLHRPRPNPDERSPPGGATSTASGGGLGSRRPDGQCTVTEV